MKSEVTDAELEALADAAIPIQAHIECGGATTDDEDKVTIAFLDAANPARVKRILAEKQALLADQTLIREQWQRELQAAIKERDQARERITLLRRHILYQRYADIPAKEAAEQTLAADALRDKEQR